MAAPRAARRAPASNAATIGRRELEARILEGLKRRLMAPDLVREFVDAFHKEANKAAAERQQIARAAAARVSKLIERKIAAIVAAIENGRYSPAAGRPPGDAREREDQPADGAGRGAGAQSFGCIRASPTFTRQRSRSSRKR